MLQCSQCEFFVRGPGNQVGFRCDPFSTIKEPECLVKWQLIKSGEVARQMDRMVRAYEATVKMYEKLAPLQEKMFRHMEREIDEYDEAERWKYVDTNDDEEVEGDEDQETPDKPSP
jgi:hypothetical protein